jgi:nanoRNase/pAp phosphatase (c-di-AMP/oligoRNAs hydrolase)
MARFGGGGHVRAAGAIIRGGLAATREDVLNAARAALDAATARAAVTA